MQNTDQEMDKKPTPENAPPGEIKSSTGETPEKDDEEIFEHEDIEMEPTQEQDQEDQNCDHLENQEFEPRENVAESAETESPVQVAQETEPEPDIGAMDLNNAAAVLDDLPPLDDEIISSQFSSQEEETVITWKCKTCGYLNDELDSKCVYKVGPTRKCNNLKLLDSITKSISQAKSEREIFMKEQFIIRQKINRERELAYDNNPFNYKRKTPSKKQSLNRCGIETNQSPDYDRVICPQCQVPFQSDVDDNSQTCPLCKTMFSKGVEEAQLEIMPENNSPENEKNSL